MKSTLFVRKYVMENIKMWFCLNFYNVEYLYVCREAEGNETGPSSTKVGANCSVQLNLL